MTAVLAHGDHVTPSVAVSSAALRWVVLLAATALAAWRLRRGHEGDALLTALVGAVVCTTSPVLLIHRTAVTLWLAALVAWVVPPRRLGTAGIAVVAAATTAGSGFWLAVDDRVRLDALAFDRLVVGIAPLLAGAVVLGLRRRTRLSSEDFVLTGQESTKPWAVPRAQCRTCIFVADYARNRTDAAGSAYRRSELTHPAWPCG